MATTTTTDQGTNNDANQNSSSRPLLISSSKCDYDESLCFEGHTKKANTKQEIKDTKKKEIDTITTSEKIQRDKVEDVNNQDYRANNSKQVAKKHIYIPRNMKNLCQKNIVHKSLKNSFTQSQKKVDCDEISHTTLLDVQCRRYASADETTVPLSSASIDSSKEACDTKIIQGQSKTTSQKSPTQFNYNSIDTPLDSNSIKKSKQSRYERTSTVESTTKEIKKSEETESCCTKSTDSTRKFLWGSKNVKPTNKTCNKSSKQQKQDKSDLEKQSKNKKSNPLEKFGRSLLTIEPDKITINLSKYSPCASRLAAGSKILSTDMACNLESPLHVARSRSPSHVDVQTENTITTKPIERTSMQASLSLNIQQFQKARFTPRSRSVGDSSVTSPTSEATTLSYSPTGTEILSLEEVCPQTSSGEGSSSYSEVKERLDAEYTDKIRRATLETKC